MNRRWFLLGSTAAVALGAMSPAMAMPETRRVKLRVDGFPQVDMDVPVGHYLGVSGGTRVTVWKREGNTFTKVSEMDYAIGRNGYSPDCDYILSEPVG